MNICQSILYDNYKQFKYHIDNDCDINMIIYNQYLIDNIVSRYNYNKKVYGKMIDLLLSKKVIVHLSTLQNALYVKNYELYKKLKEYKLEQDNYKRRERILKYYILHSNYPFLYVGPKKI